MKWISYVYDADNGSETDAHETREAAEAAVEKWLDHCRDYAHDDGWPLDMTAYVALVVSELTESLTEAPEDSSFDHFADYHMVPLPDERDARIAALEAEVESLRADLARERGSRAEVPTHADIDAHPDPVAAVERVTGMRWKPATFFAGDWSHCTGDGALAWSSPSTGWTVFEGADDTPDLVGGPRRREQGAPGRHDRGRRELRHVAHAVRRDRGRGGARPLRPLGH